MGKETGFLEYHRQENTIRSPKDRIEALDGDERKRQAAICMNCGVPFCQSGMVLAGMMTGCPLHNLIPEWNDEIYKGNIGHAVERLLKTNPFPEFTGRVCPALCEKACMCGQYDQPVTIHDNEKYLIESAFEKGLVTPQIPDKRSGKNVAVIGSGPSGLACANYLNRRGHTVTVYERDDAPGGLLMYGIPNMKLDKSVIERRIRLMEEEGVVFLCNSDVGGDISYDSIKEQYDAIILCCGAKKARGIPAVNPGTTRGVYYAVDFLKATTKSLMDSDTHDRKWNGKGISARDKNVIIVGGGDTGNDCIGTCIRHGAKSVTAIEMMPKPPIERSDDNPWPQWPKVLKTDYGHQEAAWVFGHDIRRFQTTVHKVKTDKKGQICSATLAGVSFESGKPVVDEKHLEEIPCDLLLIAVGFLGCEDYVAEAFGIEKNPRGNIVTGVNSHRIGDSSVFCAGDMHIGQSLVVRAIAEGLSAAREADGFLMGYRVEGTI